jgi:hypothetical protein
MNTNTFTTPTGERFYYSAPFVIWPTAEGDIHGDILKAAEVFLSTSEPIVGWHCEHYTRFVVEPISGAPRITFYHHHIKGLTNFLEFRPEDNPYYLGDTGLKMFGGRMNSMPTAVERIL